MKKSRVDIKMDILLAAKRLFALQGYEATTVRQICEESGVNVMMVSYHFGGKENVLCAIFQAFLPLGCIHYHDNEVNDPIRELLNIIQKLILINDKDPELVTLLQQEMLFNTPRNESMQRLMIPIWMRLRKLLEIGREIGDIEFESTDMTIIFVISTILMFKHREFLNLIFSGPLPLKEVYVREISTFIFNALKYRGNIDRLVHLI